MPHYTLRHGLTLARPHRRHCSAAVLTHCSYESAYIGIGYMAAYKHFLPVESAYQWSQPTSALASSCRTGEAQPKPQHFLQCVRALRKTSALLMSMRSFRLM